MIADVEAKIEEIKQKIEELVLNGYTCRPYLEREKKRLRLRKRENGRDRWASIALRDIPENRWEELQQYALALLKKKIESKAENELIGKIKTLEAFDRAQADIITSYFEKFSQFDDIFRKVGMRTTLLLLRYAEPDSIEDFVKGPEKFADFVLETLASLINASDPEEVIEQQKYMEKLEAKVKLQEKDLKKSYKLLREYANTTSVLASSMCPDCARRAMMALATLTSKEEKEEESVQQSEIDPGREWLNDYESFLDLVEQYLKRPNLETALLTHQMLELSESENVKLIREAQKIKIANKILTEIFENKGSKKSEAEQSKEVIELLELKGSIDTLKHEIQLQKDWNEKVLRELESCKRKINMVMETDIDLLPKIIDFVKSEKQEAIATSMKIMAIYSKMLVQTLNSMHQRIVQLEKRVDAMDLEKARKVLESAGYVVEAPLTREEVKKMLQEAVKN